MTSDRQAKVDRRLEMVIGRTLRIGVITAAVLVFVGGVYYLMDNASAPADYHAFHPAVENALDFSGVIRNALALNSLGIIQLGLLVLIVTPILRVVFCVAAFALERDIVYVIVTVTVLAVLLYGLLAQGQ